MRNTVKNLLGLLVLAVFCMAAFNAVSTKKDNKQIEYSQFMQQVNKGEIIILPV